MKDYLKRGLAVILLIVILAMGFIFPAIMMFNPTVVNYTKEEDNNIIIERFIDEDFDTIETAAVPVEEEVEPDINDLAAEIYYTTTGVHVRKEPSLEGEIFKTAVINTELEVVGSINEWSIVRIDGQKYYIYTLYISKEKTKIETTSRGKTTTRTSSNFTQPAAATQNSNGEFLGYYTLTYYCSCSKCCGNYANGITAWGTKATAGRTVAVPTSISLGTKLNIGGHIYTAEDRGGAIKGNKIDVYVDSHSEALAKGVTYNIPVWISE